jgi:hypothetical protein
MKNPTESELWQAMPHLAFEFHHFCLYGHQIQFQKDHPSAFLEEGHLQAIHYAFLLHFRAILDFFFAHEPLPDDLRVQDFEAIPAFLPSDSEPPWNTQPVWCKDLRVNLNKRLAHITARRWREEAPEMPYYHQHLAFVCELIDSFTLCLPPEYQSRLHRVTAARKRWNLSA